MLRNDSPEESMAGMQLLLEGRALELIQEANDFPQTSVCARICENLSFQGVVVSLEEIGVYVPLGLDARLFIALVIATYERTHEQFNFSRDVPSAFEEADYGEDLDPTQQLDDDQES